MLFPKAHNRTELLDEEKGQFHFYSTKTADDNFLISDFTEQARESVALPGFPLRVDANDGWEGEKCSLYTKRFLGFGSVLRSLTYRTSLFLCGEKRKQKNTEYPNLENFINFSFD